MGHLKTDSRKRFSVSLKASLASAPEAADSILEMYGFNSTAQANPSEDDELAFKNYLHFVNDVGYYAATVSFARGWPEPKLFSFAFNEPNPWAGLYKGEATHVLDVVFLFQNYNDKLSPAQKKAAEGFGLDFARFLAGQEPWPAYTKAKKTAKVFGPTYEGSEAVSKIISDNESEGTGRRVKILEIGRAVGFDVLANAIVRFQMGL
jgi:carboxylesterase type B